MVGPLGPQPPPSHVPAQPVAAALLPQLPASVIRAWRFGGRAESAELRGARSCGTAGPEWGFLWPRPARRRRHRGTLQHEAKVRTRLRDMDRPQPSRGAASYRAPSAGFPRTRVGGLEPVTRPVAEALLPGQPEGARLAVGLAPPSGGPSRLFLSGARPSLPLSLTSKSWMLGAVRPRGSRSSRGGFSAL